MFFKKFFGSFYKKKPKIIFTKNFKKNYFYKKKKKTFFLKNMFFKKIKNANQSILFFLKSFKKRFFVFYFAQIFNVKKKVFLKNRETFYNTVHINFTKNKHSHSNILKKIYFYKNIFKSKLFLYKYKKPAFKKILVDIKQIKLLKQYEKSNNFERRLLENEERQ